MHHAVLLNSCVRLRLADYQRTCTISEPLDEMCLCHYRLQIHIWINSELDGDLRASSISSCNSSLHDSCNSYHCQTGTGIKHSWLQAFNPNCCFHRAIGRSVHLSEISLSMNPLYEAFRAPCATGDWDHSDFIQQAETACCSFAMIKYCLHQVISLMGGF